MPEDSKNLRSISQIKANRGVVKRQTTLMKNYVINKGDEANLYELQTKLGLLESYFNNFNHLQTKLETLDEKEQEADDRQNYEENYFEIKSKLLALIDNKTPKPSFSLDATTLEPSHLSTTSKSHNIKSLDLPKFNGEVTEWLDFWNIFSKLVHENDSLSETTKFQHLRNCLTDNAKDVIRNMENLEGSYQAAIQNLPKVTTSNLRPLIDKTRAHVRSLSSIAEKGQIADALLIHLLTSRLDSSSQLKWEEFLAEKFEINENSDDVSRDRSSESEGFLYPTWETFTGFLDKRCRTLETLEAVSTGQFSRKSNVKQKQSFATIVKPNENCIFCRQSQHSPFKCSTFKDLTPLNRFNETKRLKLCIQCLRSGHSVKKCKGKKCFSCNENHHTLLCRKQRNLNQDISDNAYSSTNSSPTSLSQQTSLPSLQTFNNSDRKNQTSNLVLNDNNYNSSCNVSENNSQLNSHASSEKRYVLLPTALIQIRDSTGRFISCRALLDSASQTNFITEELACRLAVKTSPANISVSGIGNVKTNVENEIKLQIKSRINRFTAEISALVIKNITGYQPSVNFDIDKLQVPANIPLADPYFNQPNKIDLLIGADLFWRLLCIGQIKNGDSSPVFQKTVFGWIASGNIYDTPKFSFCSSSNIEPENHEEELNALLKRFWEIENSFEVIKKLSLENIACEEHFKDNFSRAASGRYIVKLPFRHEPSKLGDSFQIALRRFFTLERKLSSDSSLKIEYSKFLNEYLELGHMEQITKEQLNSSPHYFLPHHCVTKLESSSTKYRVVFDGSCKTSTSKSLNDILMVGPTIQEDLFSIILRFRCHRYVIMSDIVKMYRQVLVHESHRNFQCILWRNDPTAEEIKIFRLCTVTYGTAPAAFLAVRSLNQLALEEEKHFPVGSKIVLRDFYVDNLMSGADSLDDLKQIKNEVTSLLTKGGFVLKKWCSNIEDIISDISIADRETSIKIENEEIVKVLGVNWIQLSDEFLFYYKDDFNKGNLFNKRSILSEIARFFDPLGLINPIITAAKIFKQHLWKIKVDWDESLPIDLHTKWLEFRNQLKLVNNIRIPRYACLASSEKELHCFADASQKAYGSCIYLKNTDSQNNIFTSLLCAKSRVAPIKKISLPRLELCAALLLAELLCHVKSSISTKIDKIFCWSDSTIVLCWINSESYEWSTFISNRISKIQSLTTDCIWKHIPSELNPADLISRGCTPKNLIENKLWFNGPDFLSTFDSTWPPQPNITNSEVPERKTFKFSFISTKAIDLVANNKFINNYFRLIIVFGYIHRFVSNCKTKKKELRSYGHLSVAETRHSLIYIVRNIQSTYFVNEIKSLHNQQLLKSDSPIKCLHPFIDQQGILRVGGRIAKSNLIYNAKHQMLLPKSHPFTDEVIRYNHIINLHCGIQNLLNIIRQQFWIINAKTVIRKIIHRCITCFRSSPIISKQIMANLPQDRLVPSRPFSICGVDFGGPFYVTSKIRGRAPTKAYISLFVCFSTKAVHIELVSDLTTNSFIAALKRFFARRGKSSKIYSDNATNFVGANQFIKELTNLFSSEAHNKFIQDLCLINGVDWIFIPPRSPHFGGIWESAIKVAKTHIYKVCKGQSFTFDELNTIICQIEAVMNSRPISPLSTDPTDTEALTPGHFLIGAPLTTINQPNIEHFKLSYTNRYKLIETVQQNFWHHWKKGYLNNLQHRRKWNDPQDNLQIGELVILKEDNIPPLKWPLGRITQIHPGKDNMVRVVSIKTSTGEYTRGINKICRLPIEQQSTISPVEGTSFQGGRYGEFF